MRRARTRPLAAGLLLALFIATSAEGCRYVDHKYWSLPLSEALSRASWKASSPRLHDFLAAMAFFVDLPLLAVTLPHDVYALFALDDEGTGGGPAPATPSTPATDPGTPAAPRPRPGVTVELPPPPPPAVVTVVDPGQPAVDADWSRGALEVERVE